MPIALYLALLLVPSVAAPGLVYAGSKAVKAPVPIVRTVNNTSKSPVKIGPKAPTPKPLTRTNVRPLR